MPDVVLTPGVEQDEVSDVPINFSRVVLWIALLARYPIAKIGPSKHFVHQRFDQERHIVVQVNIDGTVIGQDLPQQDQTFAKKFQIVGAFPQVRVGIILAARLENALGRIRWVNINETNFSAHRGIARQRSQNAEVVAVI